MYDSKAAHTNHDSSKGSSFDNEKNLSDSEKTGHVPVDRNYSIGSRDSRHRGDEIVEKNLSDSKQNGHVPVSRNPSIRSKASQHGGDENVEKTPVEEAKALENFEMEQEYPSGIKLTIITTALCLSVFCMALVSLLLRYRSVTAQSGIISTAC